MKAKEAELLFKTSLNHKVKHSLKKKRKYKTERGKLEKNMSE